jgi:hypothetical protein
MTPETIELSVLASPVNSLPFIAPLVAASSSPVNKQEWLRPVQGAAQGSLIFDLAGNS